MNRKIIFLVTRVLGHVGMPDGVKHEPEAEPCSALPEFIPLQMSLLKVLIWIWRRLDSLGITLEDLHTKAN